jgi:hypothetical protein
MKKPRRTGASHYRINHGLKPILVYVNVKTHRKLMKLSRAGGSLQKLARGILEKFALK